MKTLSAASARQTWLEYSAPAAKAPANILDIQRVTSILVSSYFDLVDWGLAEFAVGVAAERSSIARRMQPNRRVGLATFRTTVAR
jgi:hypothetical protein